MQELGQSTMFSSCLNYVTLRLLGEMCTHEALTRGREWIVSHGSAAAIPQWGKIWLSVHLEIIKTLTILFFIYEYKRLARPVFVSEIKFSIGSLSVDASLVFMFF